MNWLDGLILAVTIILGLIGWKLGLVRSFFLVAGLLLALILAAQISGPVAGWITESAKNDALASVILYSVIFFVVFVAVQIVGNMVARAVDLGFLHAANAFAGTLLGLGTGLLIGGGIVAGMARYAFLVEPGKLERASDIVTEVQVRENLKDALVDSRLVGGYLTARDKLPGKALGMVPGDYRTALDVLDNARENR